MQTDKNQKPDLQGRLKSWWDAATSNPYFGLTLLGGLVVAMVDQATKSWVVKILHLPERRQIDLGPIFDLTYVQNRGASFGMLSGGMSSRIILSLLALAIMSVMVAWLGSVHRRVAVIGIAFIIGGALGNLIDRVLYGYVIDFLDFSGLFFPWVFNVADMAINVGVGCLIADAVLESRESAHEAAKMPPGEKE